MPLFRNRIDVEQRKNGYAFCTKQCITNKLIHSTVLAGMSLCLSFSAVSAQDVGLLYEQEYANDPVSIGEVYARNGGLYVKRGIKIPITPSRNGLVSFGIIDMYAGTPPNIKPYAFCSHESRIYLFPRKGLRDDSAKISLFAKEDLLDYVLDYGSEIIIRAFGRGKNRFSDIKFKVDGYRNLEVASHVHYANGFPQLYLVIHRRGERVGEGVWNELNYYYNSSDISYSSDIPPCPEKFFQETAAVQSQTESTDAGSQQSISTILRNQDRVLPVNRPERADESLSSLGQEQASIDKQKQKATRHKVMANATATTVRLILVDARNGGKTHKNIKYARILKGACKNVTRRTKVHQQQLFDLARPLRLPSGLFKGKVREAAVCIVLAKKARAKKRLCKDWRVLKDNNIIQNIIQLPMVDTPKCRAPDLFVTLSQNGKDVPQSEVEWIHGQLSEYIRGLGLERRGNRWGLVVDNNQWPQIEEQLQSFYEGSGRCNRSGTECAFQINRSKFVRPDSVQIKLQYAQNKQPASNCKPKLQANGQEINFELEDFSNGIYVLKNMKNTDFLRVQRVKVVFESNCKLDNKATGKISRRHLTGKSPIYVQEKRRKLIVVHYTNKAYGDSYYRGFPPAFHRKVAQLLRNRQVSGNRWQVVQYYWTDKKEGNLSRLPKSEKKFYDHIKNLSEERNGRFRKFNAQSLLKLLEDKKLRTAATIVADSSRDAFSGCNNSEYENLRKEGVAPIIIRLIMPDVTSSGYQQLPAKVRNVLDRQPIYHCPDKNVYLLSAAEGTNLADDNMRRLLRQVLSDIAQQQQQ